MSDYSDVEYVFEPHAATLPDVREYLEALWERRQFMRGARQRRSADACVGQRRSGSLWGVLDPLFQAGIYYFLYVVLAAGRRTQVEFLPVLIADIFLSSA